MPRTTLNIDGPILQDLKRLQKREGKPLGRLVSDLLARALSRQKAARPTVSPLRWISRPMGARVDPTDKDAVYALLDRERHTRTPIGRRR